MVPMGFFCVKKYTNVKIPGPPLTLKKGSPKLTLKMAGVTATLFQMTRPRF